VLNHAYKLGSAKALRNILLGGKGVVPSGRGTAVSALVGGSAGMAAAPHAAGDRWEDSSKLEKAMMMAGGGVLGAGGALTGHDRFGALGALAGGAGAAGIQAGLGRLAPTGDEFKDTVGRGLAQATQGSLGGSLLFSSMMRGSGVRRAVTKALQRNLGSVDEGRALADAGFAQMDAGGPLGALADLQGKELGRVGRFFDSSMGSPSVARSVKRHGDIQGIPAGEFVGSNVKDMAMGTAAGAAMLPATLPLQMLAERNQRKAKEERSWLGKAKKMMEMS
jgi:hypothetical protein